MGLSTIFAIHLHEGELRSNNKIEASPRLLLFGAYIQDDENLQIKKFHKASNIKCSIENTCIPKYGICLSKSECACNKGYINFLSEGKILPNALGKYCSYRQKKQLLSFLLESFLTFGVGHFYAERYTIGYSKLLLCSLVCAIFLFEHFKHQGFKFDFLFKSSPLTLVVFVFLGIILAVWQIVDMVLIGLNKYYDGNNMPLQGW